MTGFVVRNFSGVAPRVNPRLLADNKAQSASNCVVTSGTLRPLKTNLAVMTLPKSGTIRTIHRFGQDVAEDDRYWFHWADDVDVVRGPIFGDTQERTYWTGDGLPKVSDNSIALSGGTQYPMNAYTLGIPAPATAPIATVGGTATPGALAEARVYVETFVSGWGEEGCPSNASNEVDVLLGQSVTLSLSAVPTGAYNLTARRIYRSVPGSSGTPYLFVTEIPIASATYTDSLTADALGELLPSLDYAMPPAALRGLVAMPGGVMAGFVGRDVFFCEPFKPHAWPIKYSQPVDSEIVALAVFDTTLLVLTKGAPTIISGSHPENYTPVKCELPQAGVSKRSVVDVGGGVAYASPDGLFLVGGGVTRNLTEAHFTRREWQAMRPSELSGYLIDGRYVGFNSTGGFVLDLISGDLIPLNWTASAGFYDPIRDALFLVTDGNQLVKFDAGATDSTLTWKSKDFYVPKPINMGAARVEAAAYPVTFKVYADGVLKHTQTVSSALEFRLPDGFLAHTWAFEVSGTHEIYSAAIAETALELQNG